MTSRPRVVSLVPSATETLLAWGIEPVAVTRFCEHPELPAVGGTKDPDVSAIVALAPDLVVLCDEENRREDGDALATAGLDLFVISVRTVADVDTELARLAGRLDVAWTAPPRSSSPELPGPLGLRAFVPIWRRPWMTVNRDTYGSSLLATIGVDNVFGDADARYPEVGLDSAIAHRPDLVLAPSEPYPFRPRHEAELAAVAPVVFVDGQDLFWWGVRTPDAAVRLRAQITRSSR